MFVCSIVAGPSILLIYSAVVKIAIPGSQTQGALRNLEALTFPLVPVGRARPRAVSAGPDEPQRGTTCSAEEDNAYPILPKWATGGRLHPEVRKMGHEPPIPLVSHVCTRKRQQNPVPNPPKRCSCPTLM